ncbi:sorbosone dehydrogenase family protein [Salegentibacter sp. JZCK2]|uniref:PQQ-dependent sugar dehydrogenase n=1 Tax=Salegentibacter tibetensis TaxID=2873600 RepID=UPI001CCAE5AB|nr:sorbosone dehydrogenase family protein [Salegentibacter tibetensis]MBZ9728904.1 sorbosone dehydrogenase family protein [Salegentibacter tibetensis]
MKKFSVIYCLAVLLAFPIIAEAQVNEDLTEEKKEKLSKRPADIVQTEIGELRLVPPFSSESVTKESKVIGWGDNKPNAPAGFKVTKFAENLNHPRRTYIAPNDDIFVVESNTENSADRITLIRDIDQDGTPDYQEVFLDNLNQPYGMLILNDYFYVANTDGLYRYPYTEGDTEIKDEGEKILNLPAGGYNNHWTRNLIANKEGSKIYVSVGSASNVGEYGMEKEKRRAAILEINPDGTGEKIYASGLRNPVGMDWNPVTGELWTAVNERDKIGNNLVPDYITSVQEDGWYGWPYSYYGQIQDPRWAEDPHKDLVEKAIVPDVPVGPHTASLGLAFYTKDKFPDKYKNGAFVGQHGSWNRAVFSGYKILFVPFDENGKPGQPEDFLTGFIANEAESKVYGRPVGVSITPDGALLVSDDDANVIWKVSAE